MSYPCSTEETQGLRLNNSSRQGGKRTCPNFQLSFLQPPFQAVLKVLWRGSWAATAEEISAKKSHCLIQLTHWCSISRTWKASQVERAQRTQTRCLCTCNYVSSRLHARPGDFTGAALFKNQCTVPWEASPKRTGKGTNMSLQENWDRSNYCKYMKEKKHFCSCMDVHAHTLNFSWYMESIWCKRRNSFSYQWSWVTTASFEPTF